MLLPNTIVTRAPILLGDPRTQSSWSRVSEAQSTASWPCSSTAKPSWSTGDCDYGNCTMQGRTGPRVGSNFVTCLCAVGLPALGALVLLLLNTVVDGGWYQTCFKGIVVSAVHKLRRVLVTLSMRYFSAYTVNLFVSVYTYERNVILFSLQ